MLGREAKRRKKDVFILGNVAYESEYLALCEHDTSGVDTDGANAELLGAKSLYEERKSGFEIKRQTQCKSTTTNTSEVDRYAMVVPRSPKLQSLSMRGYTERHT